MRGYFNDSRIEDIKGLIKKSRFLQEQASIDRVNVAKDIESSITKDSEEYDDNDVDVKNPEDKVQKYRISGGIIALHGKEKSELEITSDEKLAFQETMDEFVEEVSDLVDFNELNIYRNSVEWSGKIIDEDLQFIFMIGEESGIYIDGQNVKVDEEFLNMINKLQQYYQKFKSKWSKVLASRKKTSVD